MRQYISFFKIRFINTLQYRSAAYAAIVTQFVWGFMEIMLYRAFYRANPSAFPMNFSDLSSYTWMREAFLALFFIWSMDESIFSDVISGNVAYDLCRPIDIYIHWFIKNMAVRLAKVALRCLPILVIAALFPYPYGLSLPVDVTSFVMFLITLVMGFIIVVAFCMLIYISAFYTISPLGVRIVVMTLTEFLSGSVVPLPFFPKGLQTVINLTPFAAMQNLPFRIYSGDISGRSAFTGVALQLFWLVILITLGRLWTKKAVKKIVVQGG